eukprot:jgi/Chlat1/1113/Chrsp110S01594
MMSVAVSLSSLSLAASGRRSKRRLSVPAPHRVRAAGCCRCAGEQQAETASCSVPAGSSTSRRKQRAVEFAAAAASGLAAVALQSAAALAEEVAAAPAVSEVVAGTTRQDWTTNWIAVAVAAAGTLTAARTLLGRRNNNSAAPGGRSRLEVRQQLLDLIQDNSKPPQDEVETVAQELITLNPTKKPARSKQLLGNWRLLYSSESSDFNTLRSRLPFKVSSRQVLGPEAGDGRVENIAEFGSNVRLRLGAGCDIISDDTCQIGPPFKIALEFGDKLKLPVGLPGSDQNFVEQLYIDDQIRLSRSSGKNGGGLFVHERIA